MQLNFVGLRHDVDGKVWTKSVGTQDIFRLDLATNKWERFQPLKELAGAGLDLPGASRTRRTICGWPSSSAATSARSTPRPAR